MKNKKYFFRKGHENTQGDAQFLGEFLESNSIGKPGELVKLAQDPTSPVHKYFDWDDTEAARKYRLWQARQLISSLYIRIEHTETRAYESVRITVSDDSTERAYVSTERITEAPELYAQVVATAKRELIYWESKYYLYEKHLPKIFAAIKEMKEEKPSEEESNTRRNRGTDANHSSNRT